MTKIIRAGLSQVKMAGETAQVAISIAKEKAGGKFLSLKHFLEHVDRRKVNRRVVKMLVDAGCFDRVFQKEQGPELAALWKLYFDDLYDNLEKRSFSDLLIEKLKTLEADWEMQEDNIVIAQQEALKFKLDNDMFGVYRKLATLLRENLKVNRIGDIVDKVKDDKEKLYLAQATSIKFGYSERATKAAKAGHKTGTADALGGIYGNLDDGSGFTMAIYRPELYKKKKEKIEKIKGEPGVFCASHPMAGKSNIWVSDFTLLKDLSRGNPGKLLKGELELVKENPDDFDVSGFNKKVRACDKCSLHKTCRAPVPPSIGKANIMVIGEAPGEDEDKAGKGFIGRSGQLLFEELKRVGIDREICLVANTVACRPPNNKLPNVTFIPRCPWATEVIQTFRPKFILASGNSALYYFRREPKGITQWNAKTEWNNRAEAWVTYCLHPAAALYERANLPLLRKALEEFARVIGNFS